MQKYDLICQKGATFRKALRLKQNGAYIDLTGWTAKSQVRTEPDGGQLLCEMDVTVDEENSRIVMLIDPAVTAAFPAGIYTWDIRVTDDDGISAYYLGGAFKVIPSVTE
ncbi:MAG: hypothetical protein IJI57_17395 [Flexilinea sp.]|nr:hypothetical protein [Flexilinea sp.]